MADVFVSYAHSNRKRVEPICSNFEQAGFSLWWDRRLRPGDDFSLLIERELQNAGCVVVVWSEAARNSLWVRAEATEALDSNKLAQVRVDGVKPPLPFTVIQMQDLTRWRGGRAEAPWPSVESAARAVAGGAAPALDTPVHKAPALQDFGSTAMLGWLSLALIVFVGALTFQVPDRVDATTYSYAVSASFAVASACLVATLFRLFATVWATARRA